jgi:hypothetical protein
MIVVPVSGKHERYVSREIDPECFQVGKRQRAF